MKQNSPETFAEATGALKLVDFAMHQVEALCVATGQKERREEILGLLARMIDPWKHRLEEHRQSGETPRDDNLSPIEFSVAVSAPTELCITLEPIGRRSDASNVETILSLLKELEGTYSLKLDRLNRIEDLIMAAASTRNHAPLRVSVAFAPDCPPAFGIRLNANAGGKAMGPLFTEKMLVRLGFTGAWPTVGRCLLRRGADSDELQHLVLDLSSPQARLEVHALHRRCTAEDLERAATAGAGYRSGALADFLLEQKHDSVDPDAISDELSAATSYEFTEGDPSRPGASMTYFAFDSWASKNARVDQVLARLELSETIRQLYVTSLAAMNGSIEGGTDIRGQVSLRSNHHQSGRVLRLSRSVKLRETQPDLPKATTQSGVMAVVDRYEKYEQITNHPFLHRLREEPVNLHNIWKLLANFQISISKTFSQRLALIASRVDDAHLRYIVTELLYDEMGSGNFERAHVTLFSNMMTLMEPWRSREPEDWVLAPGRRFNEAMDETYGSSNIYESLGAIVSGEIFGKQFDQFLEVEMRRQSVVEPKLFEWITLHASLEETHADESARLARLLPPEAVDAMSRGAYGLSCAAWGFLTDVYEICYRKAPGAA